ncbi:hypothetical protein [Sporosarcina sp. A2]|uniref:hypothetical protein n=1 Tax=Sporosarcina sp. A2 TaxID=3393449 RepID=UPI003D7B91AC
MSNEYEPKYLATLIYDKKNNDRSIIIKDYQTNKQIEHKINDDLQFYNQYAIYVTDKDNETNKVPLDQILKEKNYKSISQSNENNKSVSFILHKTEIAFLEKHNFIDQSNEMRLANAVWNYEIDNSEWNSPEPDMDIDENKAFFIDRYNSIINKEKEYQLAGTSFGSYTIKMDLDFDNLTYKEEIKHFYTHEKKEEVVLYKSIDEMTKAIKEHNLEQVSRESIHSFDKQLQGQYELKQEARKLLNEYSFDSTDSELKPAYALNSSKPYDRMVDFIDEKAQAFILNKSLNQTDLNTLSLQKQWTDLENKYHELGNTISPDKLNRVTAKIVENKLDFSKCLTDDKMNNRVVTMFKSDKELLKHSVDYLQRSKMYTLLSSAKNELAAVRIKSNGLENERETILKGKISDLESRIAPPLKATLENVNAKVNSSSNVRATEKNLEILKSKTAEQVHTNAEEPVRATPKKTHSAELSR